MGSFAHPVVWRLVAHRLSDEAWIGLEAEARALVALLADREPTVYRRYAHWWSTVPSAEVSVLSGWEQSPARNSAWRLCSVAMRLTLARRGPRWFLPPALSSRSRAPSRT